MPLPVGAVDVAPTIAQLCGIPSAETRSFQGRSLLPALSQEPASEDASVYAESYYPRDSFGWHELRGLLNAHFAYIDAPRPELYDLQRDPEETLQPGGVECIRGGLVTRKVGRSRAKIRRTGAVHTRAG